MVGKNPFSINTIGNPFANVMTNQKNPLAPAAPTVTPSPTQNAAPRDQYQSVAPEATKQVPYPTLKPLAMPEIGVDPIHQLDISSLFPGLHPQLQPSLAKASESLPAVSRDQIVQAGDKFKSDQQAAENVAAVKNNIGVQDARAYTLTKADIMAKAIQEHPNLQKGLDDGKITEDDIFAKILQEHPKIKALADNGEIDMGFQGALDEANNGLSTAGAFGVGAAAVPVGLGASYLGGEALQRFGKRSYGLTMPADKAEAEALQAYKAGLTDVKPRTMIDSLLDNSTVFSPSDVFLRDPTRGITGMSPFNMAGTPSKIGVDALNKANKLFVDEINPLFQKAKEAGDKVSIDSVFDKAIERVNNDKKLGQIAKDETKALIEENRSVYKSTYGKSIDYEELQKSKSNLDSFISKKVQDGKLSPAMQQNANKYSADAMRETIHTDMKAKYGVDTATKYADWANLQDAAAAGVKDATNAGLKGGAGGFISTVVDKAITPVTTNLGKGSFDLGAMMKSAPKYLGEHARDLAKGLIKGGKLFTIIEDGSIIPGSPTNIASNVFWTNAEYHDDPSNFITTNYKGQNIIIKKDQLQDIQGMKLVPMDDGSYVDEQGHIIH